MDEMRRRAQAFLVCGTALGLMLTACAPAREQSKTPRTATEQLLLSQALEQCLGHVFIPLPEGAPVFVETAALTHDDTFVREVVTSRLAKVGVLARKKEEDALYLVRVIIQALGTDQESIFWGMPPVTSVLIPFALPELAVYKRLHQEGFARLSLDFHDRATGRLLASTGWYEGKTYFTQYTVLVLVGLRSTNLSQDD